MQFPKVLVSAAGCLAVLTFFPIAIHSQSNQAPAAPPSLKTIPIPQPPNIADFVRNKDMAIALGKALFWDMQDPAAMESSLALRVTLVPATAAPRIS